jgi:hypothetical protein
MANDPAADAILPTVGVDGSQHFDGASKFEGWVGSISDDANATDPFRLFTQPSFMEWMEIAQADLLFQIQPGPQDPLGRSVIWVKRDARIRKCQSGRACWFEDMLRMTPADDPTAIYPNTTHK